MQAIQWLESEEFESLYERDYASKKIYFDCIERGVTAEVDSTELRAVLPQQPTFFAYDPSPELDGMGRFERWYGKVNTTLFRITCLLDAPQITTLIDLPIDLSSNSQLVGVFAWSSFQLLSSLSAKIFRSIIWISPWNQKANYSVFTKDKSGVVSEVYRTASQDEAEELCSFFNTKSESSKYYVSVPDEVGITYVALKVNEDGRETIAARYSTRYPTEKVAQSFSLKNTATFHVHKEKDGAISSRVATFKAGILMTAINY